MELEALMLKIIKETKGKIDEKELFMKMSEDENFNSELFRRFNLNRLKQLLNTYYMQNPNTQNIRDIYRETTS